MIVVERIFKVIKEKNITAKMLSNETGISAGNITDWKNGRSKPSYGAVVKIAKFLDVSEKYLLGEIDDMSPPKYEILGEADIDFRKRYNKLSEEGKRKLNEYLELLLMSENKN